MYEFCPWDVSLSWDILSLGPYFLGRFVPSDVSSWDVLPVHPAAYEQFIAKVKTVLNRHFIWQNKLDNFRWGSRELFIFILHWGSIFLFSVFKTVLNRHFICQNKLDNFRWSSRELFIFIIFFEFPTPKVYFYSFFISKCKTCTLILMYFETLKNKKMWKFTALIVSINVTLCRLNATKETRGLDHIRVKSCNASKTSYRAKNALYNIYNVPTVI